MDAKRSIKTTCLLIALFWLSSTAMAQLPEKIAVNPEKYANFSLPHSPGILVGDTLYLSGQSGQFDDGGYPGSMEDEVEQCFRNMDRILQAAGMSLADVVSTYVFLLDMDHYETLNTVFRETFPERPPVRSTMGVGRLPGQARIVVQAIAVQKTTERKYYRAPEGWRQYTAWWPYTGAIKVNGLLYMAGLGTADMQTGEQPPTIRLQIRQSLSSLGELLEVAGLDYRHVIFINPYLSPPVRTQDLNVVYRQFFRFGETPARATLTMKRIPDVHPVEITAVAVDDLARRTVIRPPIRELSPTASPAVMGNNVMYLSGFSGFIPGLGYITEDIESQTHFALRNILDCLQTAGMRWSNLVSLNAYLGDLGRMETVMEVYDDYFPDAPPALTIMQQSPDGPDNRPAIQFSGIAVRSTTR